MDAGSLAHASVGIHGLKLTAVQAGVRRQAGTPELASSFVKRPSAISGQLKDSVDRSYYAALDQVDGRPYASPICAGSGGQNAAPQTERIATGWRLKPVADPLIACTHAQTLEAILATKGVAAAAMAPGVFQRPEPTPSRCPQR